MTEQDLLNAEATNNARRYGRMVMDFTEALFMTKPVPTVSAAEICKRLDDGEDYGEGTPLEKAILELVRFTGQPIECTDKSGNLMILDDVEGMDGGNA
jgi:hypothetical protein